MKPVSAVFVAAVAAVLAVGCGGTQGEAADSPTQGALASTESQLDNAQAQKPDDLSGLPGTYTRPAIGLASGAIVGLTLTAPAAGSKDEPAFTRWSKISRFDDVLFRREQGTYQAAPAVAPEEHGLISFKDEKGEALDSYQVRKVWRRPITGLIDAIKVALVSSEGPGTELILYRVTR